jgi:hypothetical protein
VWSSEIFRCFDLIGPTPAPTEQIHGRGDLEDASRWPDVVPGHFEQEESTNDEE